MTTLEPINPCVDTDAEEESGLVSISGRPVVQLRIWLCETAAMLTASLRHLSAGGDSIKLIPTDTFPPPNPITVDLPTLEPGLHTLAWTALPNTEEWRIVAEVLVDQTIRFRRSMSSGSGLRINTDFAVLEVRS